MSATPRSSGPGDRPAIPLEAEPLAFFHALTAGAAVPVPTALDGEVPLLEEEPALWPDPGPAAPA